MEQKGQVNGAFIFLERPAELKRLLRGSSRLVEDIEEAIHLVGDVDMKLGCRRLGAFSQGSKAVGTLEQGSSGGIHPVLMGEHPEHNNNVSTFELYCKQIAKHPKPSPILISPNSAHDFPLMLI
jgi:hypothetical protein